MRQARRKFKRHRDAGDGRFVSKEEAEARPKETVSETVTVEERPDPPIADTETQTEL
jgi:hypothetical protein